MRVALLLGRSTGGIGAHVHDLATGLGAAGVDVAVATADSTASRFDLGSRVHLLWPTGSMRSRVRALAGLRRLAAGADVLHAHGHQAGLLAVAVAATLRRRRPAVVISWHNAVLGAGVGRRVRAVLEAVQARRATLVTGASSDLVLRAARLGARSPELAPVAAATAGTWVGNTAAVRQGLAASDGVDAHARLVLTVSRIAPQKNLDVLVDAAAMFGGGVEWVVAGDGDAGLLLRLRDRAARTGAPVTFVGSRADVGALLAAADVFALPSAWEARALVVQEALAAGTPVVASDTGGLPDLLAGAGVLVPVGNAEALARAVGDLLRDPVERRRRSTRGRQRFAELPGTADMLRTWADTYARVARRGG